MVSVAAVRGRLVVRPSIVVATSMACAAVALTVTAGIIGVRVGGQGAAEVVWLVAWLSYALVGALIVWHRPDSAVGWLFGVVGILVPLAGLASGLATYTLVVAPGSIPAGAYLRWLQDLLFTLTWGLATTFPLLLYPDGRLPSPRWRPVAYLATGTLAVTVLGYALAPGPIGESIPIDNPLGVAAFGAVPKTVADVGYLALLGISALCLASLVVRWRRAQGRAARQLAWLALAPLVIAVLLAALTIVESLGYDGTLLAAAMLVTVPAATAVAILRDRLFDVQAVLNRALVYLLLTCVVVGAYAALLAVASHALDAYADVGVSLLGSALVAVAVSPLKERLQRGVDRLLYGERRLPEAVLSTLGVRLQEVAAPDRMLPAAVRTVRDALRLTYVAIEVADTVMAASGDPVPDPFVVDLVLHGRPQGRLLVARRSPGEEFTAAERDLLEGVARHVAVAARAVRLTTDLQRSRERLVAAREEERLRLRRDLHDGVGPVLAAVTLRLDGLRRHLDAEDDTGRALLDKAKREVRQCLDDLRRIIEDLRPPALDELGLAGVVGEQAAALEAAGLHVSVHCHPGEVAAATEVAAYRIVTEALTNVVRHAAASRCAVRIIPDGDRLVITVSDDGQGLPPDQPDGVELASMRERAAELGGVLTVTGPPGQGVAVRAELPLAEATP